MQTAEPLVPEPSRFEAEIDIEKQLELKYFTQCIFLEVVIRYQDTPTENIVQV
jgi:hypothetical protein